MYMYNVEKEGRQPYEGRVFLCVNN